MYFRFYVWRHVCSWAKVARSRHPVEAQCTCCLGLGCNLYAVIPVAGQRTHGTTFRALKGTSQAATPGAESAVHDCVVVDWWWGCRTVVERCLRWAPHVCVLLSWMLCRGCVYLHRLRLCWVTGRWSICWGLLATRSWHSTTSGLSEFVFHQQTLRWSMYMTNNNNNNKTDLYGAVRSWLQRRLVYLY